MTFSDSEQEHDGTTMNGQDTHGDGSTVTGQACPKTDTHRARLQQQLQQLLASQAQLLSEMAAPQKLEQQLAPAVHDTAEPCATSTAGTARGTQHSSQQQALTQHTSASSSGVGRPYQSSSKASSAAAAAAAGSAPRRTSRTSGTGVRAAAGAASGGAGINVRLRSCRTPSDLAAAAKDLAGQLSQVPTSGRLRALAAATAAGSAAEHAGSHKTARSISSTRAAAGSSVSKHTAKTNASSSTPERRHQQLQQLLHEELQDLEQQLAELTKSSYQAPAGLACGSEDLSAVASALNCANEPSATALVPRSAAGAAAGAGAGGGASRGSSSAVTAAAGTAPGATGSIDPLSGPSSAVWSDYQCPAPAPLARTAAAAPAAAGISGRALRPPHSTAGVAGSAVMSLGWASDMDGLLSGESSAAAMAGELGPGVAQDQQQTIRQLHSIIAELTSQVDMLRARVSRQDGAAAELAELKVSAAASEAQVATLQQQLAQSEQVSKLAAADAAKAAAASEELVRELRRELKEVGQQAASLAGQLEAATTQAAASGELRQRLEEVEAAHQELQQEHAAVQEELATCSEARQQLLERLVEATQQVSDLHEELGPAIFRGSPPRKRPAQPLPPGSLAYASPGASPRSPGASPHGRATRRNLEAGGWVQQGATPRAAFELLLQQAGEGSGFGSWAQVLVLTRELTQLSQAAFESGSSTGAGTGTSGRGEAFRAKLQQLEQQHKALRDRHDVLQAAQEAAAVERSGNAAGPERIEELQCQVRTLQQQLQTSALALAAEQERSLELRAQLGAHPGAAAAAVPNPMAAGVTSAPDPSGAETVLEQSFRQHVLTLQQQLLDGAAREAQLSASLAQLLSGREVAARQLVEAVRIAELAKSQAVPIPAVQAAQRALGDDGVGSNTEASPGLQLLQQQLAALREQVAAGAAAAKDARATHEWSSSQLTKVVQQLQASKGEAQALQAQLLQRQDQLLQVLLKSAQPGGQGAALAELGSEVVELKQQLMQQEGAVRRLTARLQEVQGLSSGGSGAEILVVQQLEARNKQLLRDVARLSTGAAEAAALGRGAAPPLPSSLPPPTPSAAAAGATAAAAVPQGGGSQLGAEPSGVSVDLSVLAPKAAALLAKQSTVTLRGSSGAAGSSESTSSSAFADQQQQQLGLSRSLSRAVSMGVREPSPQPAPAAAGGGVSVTATRQPSRAAAYDLTAAANAVMGGAAAPGGPGASSVSRTVSRSNSALTVEVPGAARSTVGRGHVTFQGTEATTATAAAAAAAEGVGEVVGSAASAALERLRASSMTAEGSASFKEQVGSSSSSSSMERQRTAPPATSTSLASASPSPSQVQSAASAGLTSTTSAAAAAASGSGSGGDRAALVASILQRHRDSSAGVGGLGGSTGSLQTSSSFLAGRAASAAGGVTTPGAGVTPRSLVGEGSGMSAGSGTSSLVAAVLQRQRAAAGAGGGAAGAAGGSLSGAATAGRTGPSPAGSDRSALVASVLSKYSTAR